MATNRQFSNGHAVSDAAYDVTEGDGLLKLMRRFNIPITRESYLELAYMGEPPAELSARPIILRCCGS